MGNTNMGQTGIVRELEATLSSGYGDVNLVTECIKNTAYSIYEGMKTGVSNLFKPAEKQSLDAVIIKTNELCNTVNELSNAKKSIKNHTLDGYVTRVNEFNDSIIEFRDSLSDAEKKKITTYNNALNNNTNIDNIKGIWSQTLGFTAIAVNQELLQTLDPSLPNALYIGTMAVVIGHHVSSLCKDKFGNVDNVSKFISSDSNYLTAGSLNDGMY